MAGMSEAAFVAFEAEFLRNHAVCSYFSRKLYCEILHFYSFQKPEGLIRLLRAFALKPGETPE